MPLDPKLRAAYEAADYVVFGEPELVFRIGRPNADLDALLEADGALGAAYVTAANPRGLQTGAADNLAAVEALLEDLSAFSCSCYPGEGRDPEDLWTPEPSVLVVGIERSSAEELGRRLEQNAIVFVEKGQAPELVVLV